jgi:hypothetical protein
MDVRQVYDFDTFVKGYRPNGRYMHTNTYTH